MSAHFIDVDELIVECRTEFEGWLDLTIEKGNEAAHPAAGDLLEAATWLGRLQWLESIKAELDADTAIEEALDPDEDDD